MATYPDHGTPDWDDPLRDYIDSEIAALAGGLPGIELGYAERVTSTPYQTTATNASAGIVPGLDIDVEGNGRPIDIEIFISSAFHSVASTGIVIALAVDEAVTGTGPQLGAVSSPSTSIGRSATVKRRLVIADGVTKNLGVILYGTAVGTTNLVTGPTVVSHISAVSR